MGAPKKARKATFLAASRQLFSGRHWPEGYEFPACSQCNRATKDVEQIVATLSRTYPNGATEAAKARCPLQPSDPELLDGAL